MSRQSTALAPKRILAVPICLLLMALSTDPVWCQAISGTAVGTVRDASGAVVGGATVNATNVNTGIAQSTRSGGAGDYTIPNLAPGRYRITAQSKGFATAVVTDAPIQVEQTTRVDFSLSPGQAT